jgi:hypothetical protein
MASPVFAEPLLLGGESQPRPSFGGPSFGGLSFGGLHIGDRHFRSTQPAASDREAKQSAAAFGSGRASGIEWRGDLRQLPSTTSFALLLSDSTNNYRVRPSIGSGDLASVSPVTPSARTGFVLSSGGLNLDPSIGPIDGDFLPPPGAPPVLMGSSGGGSGSSYLVSNPAGPNVNPFDFPDSIDDYTYINNSEKDPPVVVPIPTPALLGGAGLLVMAIVRRRILKRA